MNDYKPVSVIVLTWNGLKYTRRCIESVLQKSTHPRFEVIVVDNGSTDGTVDYLKSIKGIRVIENGVNLGFVRGNNVGIKSTSYDVVLLNNDTEIIQPDWLERLQRLVYSSPDIGIAGCRLINSDGLLVHAGTYMPRPSYWGQEYPGGEVDIGQYTSDREVEGVIFACVYIKRAVIDAIGPLDEDYFSYYEDTDYCLKAKKAGFRVFCCGSVTVKHHENVSTALNRADFSSNFKRSRDIFISKWQEYFNKRYRQKVTWSSRFSPRSVSYEISQKIIHALDRAGVEVSVTSCSDAEKLEFDDFLLNQLKSRDRDSERPVVLFCPGEEILPRDGRYNIAYTFTPYSGFPDDLAERLNLMDEVWVPSGFQKLAAEDSGVKKDIFVVPFGIDVNYYHPGIRSYALSGRFTFFCSTRWGEESCARTLVEAFTEEFDAHENVVLLLNIETADGEELVTDFKNKKGWPVFSSVNVESEVEKIAIPPGRAHVVFIMDQRIPLYQKPSLLKSADCVVVVDRSSENSLKVLSSLACGVPVIVPDWGSAREFIDGLSVIGVRCSQIPSPKPGLMWIDAHRDDLKRKLRTAYVNGELLKAEAHKKSDIIGGTNHWENVARLVTERLEAITL